MVFKRLLRRLDLTTLQLFVAVYEEGTLTRASRRESIAVSAASKRLLELEQALGAAVFVRQAKGMVLTPAGETLLHHARQVLLEVEKIGSDLADHAAGVRGHVRMMANLSGIVEFLPEDLRMFLRAAVRSRPARLATSAPRTSSTSATSRASRPASTCRG